MRFSLRSRMSKVFSIVALTSVVVGLMMTGAMFTVPTAQAASQNASATKMHIECAGARSALCTEVHDAKAVFGPGQYVGHDEPATLFYSNQPGAGNRMLYRLQLPTDPSPVHSLLTNHSICSFISPSGLVWRCVTPSLILSS